MSLLQTMGTGQGYLKAGFLGFAKSGKTWTAKELAIGVREFFNLDGQIAMFDTEGGAEYIAHDIRERTGTDLIGIRSRSLDDLMKVVHECIEGSVSVLIVDSISHVWKETCDSYLKQMNARRHSNRMRLEFQDWAVIKKTWSAWPDLYLNSPLHIIICGRAGYEWDFEGREDGSGKDLVKTGIKMKVETEFGFEPSLLVEMERVQLTEGRGQMRKLTKQFIHRATVIGDRFGAIDARASVDDPDFDFFRPHIEMLKPGAHAPVDTTSKTDHGLDEDGDADFQRKRTERTIVLEEIQGEIVRVHPGQSAKEKAAKADLLEKHFDTRSWKKIESKVALDDLKQGLAAIRIELRGGEQELSLTPETPAEEPSATTEEL